MQKLQAVLFDLDGVLVPTTILHMEAWKELFDSFLPDDVPAYTDEDYYRYVDGKPRNAGVRAVLESRGISLDGGGESDAMDSLTINGLGTRKNGIFERLLSVHGIEPYEDTVDVLRHYIAQGARLAVVSSSKNARSVLAQAGIIRYFDEIVDGSVREEKGLRGKPAPDTFLYAAQLLGADINETAVFEDAVSGVKAARAGNFGLVVGVDRGAGRRTLMSSGADVTVSNLIEIFDGAPRDGMDSSETETDPLSQDRYPLNDWSFTEKSRPNDDSATLFSVSNGTIGVRAVGAGARSLGNGTFLSGFHDTSWIQYPENAYGLARVDQSVQGVPDASDFHLCLNARPIEQYLVDSRQTIDFRTGISTCVQRYSPGYGQKLEVEIKRAACLFEPNLAVISMKVRDEGLSGSTLEIDGHLNVQALHADMDSDDPRKARGSEQVLERISRKEAKARRTNATGMKSARSSLADSDIVDVYRTQHSRLMVAVGLRQFVNGTRTNSTRWKFYLDGTAEIEVLRYAAYHNCRIEPIGVTDGLEAHTRTSQDEDRLVTACRKTLDRYGSADDSRVLRKQRAWLTRFWKRSDIQIVTKRGDHSRMRQALRWELFQLAQASASIPNGISAKGLSGTGYSGHYFWDTEIYILPFILFSDPAKARRILDYRFSMLPAARRRAAALNLDGALFPWRTIDGEESSSYYPAGTAQYHINADIAFAVERYVSLTEDEDFLAEEGADILVETSRMWASIGFIGEDGKYHIHRVTGPDEYSALVDDNFYTNAMARFNLRTACRRLLSLAEKNPDAFAEIRNRLHLEYSELQTWQLYADRMYLPFDSNLGIHPQATDFLRKEHWDTTHFRARPLLMHYHPLEIYKKQIIKQPDVVMALYLLKDSFPMQQKIADFRYYDAITAGDSTLSATVQSAVAADIGDMDAAVRYLRQSLFVDLANTHANTADGIHLACAGGIWNSLIEGFAGLSVRGNLLEFRPHLPDDWESMTFRLTVHACLLQITIDHDSIHVKTVKGDQDFRVADLRRNQMEDAHEQGSESVRQEVSAHR
ncbi:MAG: beta-phosphoglucomutase family hydrolase [Bifidobacterium sp.]|uniref:beta-phosphoglucomutase family hydrolase n=1 Tax=Bifidobacterium sp. TaxID=41200 RepID=UPI0039E94E3B